MFTKKIIIAAIAILSAFSLYNVLSTKHQDNVPTIVHELFIQFGKKYNKVYKTPQEKMFRLRVFQETLKRVTEMQKRVSYSVGITQFSDLTIAEAKAKYTGLLLVKAKRNVIEAPLTPNVSNPASVDWRKEGAVNAVKNQRTCGACYAFSAIAALETAYKLSVSTHKLLSFSEQELVDCSTAQGNLGCIGGWMDWAFKYIETKGIETEQNYPYVDKVQSCRSKTSLMVPGTKVKSIVDLPPYNSAALETASVKTVISVTIDAETWFSYKEGILDSNCGTALNHGVAVIGYGSEGGKHYWIIRNSWGPNWGEVGYIRILKTLTAGPGMCGVTLKASYPIL